MSLIHVTGHRNPDTDSIAAAIGYAELRGRLDPENTYVPVRLGDVNAQTRWVLERGGRASPTSCPTSCCASATSCRRTSDSAGVDDPVREVGLAMAQDGLDLVPIVGYDGKLAGVMTERALARRYIRESREASTLVDAPTRISAIAAAVSGVLVAGEGDATVAGRVWVLAMDAGCGAVGHPRGRRRRGRQPRRGPAPGDRARRRAAADLHTASRPRTRSSSWPASRAPR